MRRYRKQLRVGVKIMGITLNYAGDGGEENRVDRRSESGEARIHLDAFSSSSA